MNLSGGRSATAFLLLRIARHAYRTLAGGNCDTATEIQRFGIHEPASSAILSSSVGPGDRCLDIGSNVGWFAEVMTAAGASVVTVEPNPRFGADLCLAVGSENGPALLHLSRRQNWHSLLVPISYTGKSVPVSVRTLDSIAEEFGPFSFLKLDVEGAEWDILRFSRYLRDEKPALMVELHPNIMGRARAGDLVKLLRELEYDCLAVDRMWDFEVFRRFGIDPVRLDGWRSVSELVERRQPIVLHLRGPG